MSKKQDIEQVASELLGPVVEDMGYELAFVKYVSEYGRPVLRIHIDKEGGVSIDDCALVSREVDTLIEAEGITSGPYVLEVSSPGLDRPLFGPPDYVRFTGRLVKVKTTEKMLGQKVHVGRIESADDTGFTLAPETKGERLVIHYDKVAKANLEIEF